MGGGGPGAGDHKVGVPDTGFADASFGSVYCTTTLEIIRGFEEEEQYSQCLAEILRILRLVGLLGLAEPVRLDVDLPEGLAPLILQKGEAVIEKGSSTKQNNATQHKFITQLYNTIQIIP